MITSVMQGLMEMPLIINDNKMHVATCNRVGREGEVTTFWLRYTTIVKPAFRFEYVQVYCQLADQPGKHFCDEMLTCNDACIYMIQNRVLLSTTC